MDYNKYSKNDIANDLANKKWNSFFGKCDFEENKVDNWLDDFSEYIVKTTKPIIDLGCGNGNDTFYLLNKGKEVISCDYSLNALKNIKKNFPSVKETYCFDMSKRFPFKDNLSDIIIADLSLHYFSEEITNFILSEIERILTKNGILIFRVNSINDINYGAGKGKEIEKHLYELSDGTYKRFFDKDDIMKFFSKYEIIYLNEEVMNRYGPEKRLWKVAIKINK